MDRGERITKLAAALDRRVQLEQAVLDRLKDFCSMLYTQIETILGDVERQSSVRTEGRRKSLEAGYEAFSFHWEGAYIELLPVSTVAVTSDTPLSPLIPQRVSGRLIIYRGKEDNPFEAYPAAELFVFDDGGWAAAGFAGERAEAAYTPDNLAEFVLTFLEHLTYELISYHRPRKAMQYNPDMYQPEGAIGFRRNVAPQE